jgi:hypothetical protein
VIWLFWKLLTLPIRLVLASIRLVLGTIGLIGLKRLLALGVGVGVGLLMAPTSGEQLRERLAKEWEASRSGIRAKSPLADAVRAEIQTNARTWHLPVPEVVADGSRIVLSGSVPHAEGRDELGKVAAAVSGVEVVDNQLAIGH